MPIEADRRQLLRAGMWTVPVVAVATSAPAWAASGADMSTSTISVSSPQKPILVVATIVNSGSGPTTLLTVTVTAPNAVSATQAPPNASWTVLVTGTNTVRFTYTGTLAAGASLPQTTFTVDRGNNGAGSVTVLIDPGGSGTIKSQTFTI